MGLEVHHACDEGVRNGGNADVEGVHVLVEQAAVRGDLLLEGGNARLELEKVGVGLQVGILFGDRKERAQGAGDHVVRLRFLRGGRGARVGIASLDYGLQGLLLVLHVPFAGLDQFGQFVVPLLQDHVDVGKRPFDHVLEPHQVVINAHEVGDDPEPNQHQNGQGNQGDDRSAGRSRLHGQTPSQ